MKDRLWPFREETIIGTARAAVLEAVGISPDPNLDIMSIREAAQASSIVVSALLSLQRENQENKIQCFILLGKPSSPLEEPAQLINQSIDNFCLSRTGLMTELGRM